MEYRRCSLAIFKLKLKKDSYKLYLRFGFNGRPTRISALGINEEGDSLYITVVEKVF